MKHVRRMICMAIAAVMMLAVPVYAGSWGYDSTTGYWTTPYGDPVPKSLFSDDDFRREYGINDMLSLEWVWFAEADFSDMTYPWPEEYLTEVAKTVNKAGLSSSGHISVEDDDISIPDYEWYGNKVYVDYSINCDVFHDWESYDVYDKEIGHTKTVYYLSTHDYKWDNVSVLRMAAVMRDKESGKIINLGLVSEIIKPEYRYDISEYDGMSREERDSLDLDTYYESKAEGTVKIEMPMEFDPEKHTLEVCFVSHHFLTSWQQDYTRCFSSAIEIDSGEFMSRFELGDANADGELTLDDASIMLKYIAEWDNIEIREDLSDIDGDGRIRLRDVQLLMQEIAWG